MNYLGSTYDLALQSVVRIQICEGKNIRCCKDTKKNWFFGKFECPHLLHRCPYPAVPGVYHATLTHLFIFAYIRYDMKQG
jgi:hypothetical protein